MDPGAKVVIKRAKDYFQQIMSFGPIVGDNYKIWMSITEINDSKELLGQNSEKLSLSYPQFYICSPEEEAKR